MDRSSAKNLNIVHESEVQRQYTRIKTPATLQIKFPASDNVSGVNFEVVDLSVGGVSFIDEKDRLRDQNRFHVEISFQLEGYKFSIDLALQKVYSNVTSGRVGCEFHELSNEKVSIIQLIVSSYLSGDITTVNDIMSVSKRDNMSMERLAKPDIVTKKSGWPIVASILVFLLAAIAVIYVGKQVGKPYFVASSNKAWIEGKKKTISMPVGGKFVPIIKVGDIVQSGDPVGHIDTPILSFIESKETLFTLEESRIENVIDEKMTYALSSPCDCIIKDLNEEDSYLDKGEIIISLVKKNEGIVIMSLFSFKQSKDIEMNSEASFTIPGEKKVFKGKVTNISVGLKDHNQGESVWVQVTPNEVIDPNLMGRPVTVDIKY